MAQGVLDGQIAIVTGSGRGIGRAIAGALARAGAHVVLSSRTLSEIQKAAEQIRASGGMATAIQADVSDPAQVERLVSESLKIAGKVDLLVNNAGIGFFKPVSAMDLSEFDAMWKVNVRGVFLMSKAVLPSMTKSHRGAIVNIASLAGKNTFKGGAGYGATKWALRGFAGSLMLEVREHNIRVVTIFPGSVDTSFSSSGKKGPQITQPEDVADAVIFSVTAPERSMFSEIDLRPTNPA
ncbi:MAG TPA: SDR family NAD(P)-dependent oxidoreductase [Bacteroidota bacterium]|nr:SDR family NAD(P)-dependent oxidoreductase [Bacteroidota bacterium]